MMRLRALAGRAGLAALAWLVAGCGSGDHAATGEPGPVSIASEAPSTGAAVSLTASASASPVASAPASSTLSAAPSSSAPAGASSLPAAVAASPSAASAPPPPGRPPSERPSASFKKPPGPNPYQWKRMFEAYGHLLDMDDLLADWHHRYPEKTRLVQLATTHQGRNVKALVLADDISRSAGRPSMLLNAAHHGDEPLSAVMMLDAIETLLEGSKSDPRIQRYLSDLTIWIVPLVNPDGFVTHLHQFKAGRKNGRPTKDKEGNLHGIVNRGVDLNRNYPFRWGHLREAGSRSQPEFRSYRGPQPASEPEVRAMVDLSDREHFVGSLSLHTGTVTLLAPYTIDGVPQPEPNEAWTVAEHVARGLKNGPRPVYVLKNLYPVDGTDQDYHRGAHGTLALLFEAAARDWEEPAQIKKAVDLARPSWGRLFDRYLDGPSVEGRVRDAGGRPVSVEVQVAEVKTRAGEVWKTRCPDGFFGRYLPGAGNFTVRVVSGSGAPIDTPVEATEQKGRVAVDIVVPDGVGTACSAEGG